MIEKKGMITIKKYDGMWYCQCDDWTDIFGTDTIPTIYSVGHCSAVEIVDRIEKLNPDYLVVIEFDRADYPD